MVGSVSPTIDSRATGLRAILSFIFAGGIFKSTFPGPAGRGLENIISTDSWYKDKIFFCKGNVPRMP